MLTYPVPAVIDANPTRRVLTFDGVIIALGLDVVFIAFLAAIALARWGVISSFAEPSGTDGGNWLAVGHTLLGSHSRSLSIVYPPVVPLLTVAFADVWGPLKGTQVLALLSSLAPAAGVYVLLRRSLGVRAVLVAGLLAPAVTTGEAVAWGGYPQLLALGLLAIVLWAVDNYVRTSRLRWAWIGSASFFLTLATNELVGTAAIAIVLTFLVLRVWLVPGAERPLSKHVWLAATIMFVPSLALAPTYVSLANGYAHNSALRNSNQHVTLANLQPILAVLFKDNLELWYVLLVLALLSPLVLLVGPSRSQRRARMNRGRQLAAAAAAILGPTISALFFVGETRLFFLLPIAICAALGAWWKLLVDARGVVARSLDRVLIAAMTLILIVESALGLAAFPSQVQWYAALTPGVVSGLYELDRVAPRDAVLAVSPAPKQGLDQQGWPLGWWVEGLLDRPTYFASDLQWLNTADERRRATVANEIFSSSEGVTGAVQLARARGIRYIVVATGWAGYRTWIAAAPSLDGASVIIDTDSLVVISTQ